MKGIQGDTGRYRAYRRYREVQGVQGRQRGVQRDYKVARLGWIGRFIITYNFGILYTKVHRL